MFPDHEDVIRTLKTLPSPKPTAESIYQDVVLSRLFLTEAYGRCRNHGRHNFQLASDIKPFAEGFIGKPIDDTAWKLALRMTGFQTKVSGTDKSLLVKLPPLERFEEVRELWNQRQQVEEKEIIQEQQKWAAFKAKYPKLVYTE